MFSKNIKTNTLGFQGLFTIERKIWELGCCGKAGIITSLKAALSQLMWLKRLHEIYFSMHPQKSTFSVLSVHQISVKLRSWTASSKDMETAVFILSMPPMGEPSVFLRILKISINAHVHVGDQYRTYHMSRFVSRRLDWSATIQSRCKQSFDCHTYCNNSFTTRLWNHKQPCVADMLLSLIVFSSYATYDTRIDSRSFIRSSFRHGVWALTDRHVRDETIISHAVAR